MRANGGTTGLRPEARSGTPTPSVTSRTAETPSVGGGGAAAGGGAPGWPGTAWLPAGCPAGAWLGGATGMISTGGGAFAPAAAGDDGATAGAGAGEAVAGAGEGAGEAAGDGAGDGPGSGGVAAAAAGGGASGAGLAAAGLGDGSGEAAAAAGAGDSSGCAAAGGGLAAAVRRGERRLSATCPASLPPGMNSAWASKVSWPSPPGGAKRQVRTAWIMDS